MVYPRGFPKTSVFGKATLDLWEKAGFRPLFQEPFTKLTGFWERLPRFIRLLPLIGVCFLSSCIGLNAEISLRGDGSGRMRLEYRVPRTVESLGKLDGNERWQTVPTGRADFNRTLERLPGLRLVSFSSKDDGTDIVNRVELEFKDLKALLPFLEGADPGASLTEENEKKQLSLILYPGVMGADPELLSLIREASQGYNVTVSLSAPGGAELGLTDGGGRPLTAAEGIETRPSGKKVSVSVHTGDLLSSPRGLGVEFTWRSIK